MGRCGISTALDLEVVNFDQLIMVFLELSLLAVELLIVSPQMRIARLKIIDMRER